MEWLSGESFQDVVSRGANACLGQRRRAVGADQKWTRKVPFIQLTHFSSSMSSDDIDGGRTLQRFLSVHSLIGRIEHLI